MPTGTLSYANGDVYSGEFQNNMKCGQGGCSKYLFIHAIGITCDAPTLIDRCHAVRGQWIDLHRSLCQKQMQRPWWVEPMECVC